MFGSICPCGVEGFAWLDKREIFVLSDSTCIYEHAGQREGVSISDHVFIQVSVILAGSEFSVLFLDEEEG